MSKKKFEHRTFDRMAVPRRRLPLAGRGGSSGLPPAASRLPRPRPPVGSAKPAVKPATEPAHPANAPESESEPEPGETQGERSAP